MSEHRRSLALELFQQAYMLQTEGFLDRAIELYRESIELCPTAEAHTFLGWTYRFQGKLHAAIDECKRAIEVDPSLGNPYNDIGAYLIELRQYDEAIPWLEQALESGRYDAYHYPWYNLGRAYVCLESYRKARTCFQKALEIAPEYDLAAMALDRVRRLVQ
jgi:tetratricopeptide (TPR) repeat protein